MKDSITFRLGVFHEKLEQVRKASSLMKSLADGQNYKNVPIEVFDEIHRKLNDAVLYFENQVIDED